MQNHSGIGVKTFRLRTPFDFYMHPGHLDRWVQAAITPGIREFELRLNMDNKIDYSFLCPLLSGDKGSSIQSLNLARCAFHSVDTVGCLSSLPRVHLYEVRITGEELSFFLSKSFALEELVLSDCNGTASLKIPWLLSQFKFLHVRRCSRLRMIEGNAPKLFSFEYVGGPIHISLGDSSRVREIQMLTVDEPDMLYYATTRLPFVATNLQSLSVIMLRGQCWLFRFCVLIC